MSHFNKNPTYEVGLAVSIVCPIWESVGLLRSHSTRNGLKKGAAFKFGQQQEIESSINLPFLKLCEISRDLSLNA